MAEITSGIKYLKINRLDADGEDYGSKIINADNIRINYPDVGSVLYDILTIQQQADYYLIGIINQPVTSSNPGRFGFSLIASASYNTSSLNGPAWSGGDETQYFWNIGSGSGNNNSTGDAVSFFQTGSNSSNPTKYTFRKTPNEELIIQFTCSIKNNNGGTAAPFTSSLYLIETGYPPQTIKIASASVPVLTTTTFSGSVSFSQISSLINNISGAYFNIQIYNALNVSNTTASFARLNIVASPLSLPSSSLLNITPDTINFANSDDNAIINNATIPQYSTIYQDIDYSTGLVPTNFNLLVSGNATYAVVQDSNYTATGWSNSRYKGTKIWSTDFNI